MKELYTLHYAPDNASLIIRIALEMLDVPYQLALVDRSQSAQRAPEYLALNPLGMIPALETHDGVIFETGAILLWLADRHGGLFPAVNDAARVDGLKWLFFLSNSLHAGLRQMFYPEKFAAPKHALALREGLTPRLSADFAQLEQVVRDISCTVFDDTAPSLLDIYLCTCMRWAQLYPQEYTGWLKTDEYPTIMALAARLERHPAVRHVQEHEGLGATPFTNPTYATPQIGSAT